MQKLAGVFYTPTTVPYTPAGGKRGENREGEVVKAIAKVCFLFPTQNECVQIDRERGREIQGAAEERLRY